MSEVMSGNLGVTSDGFVDNFAYDLIQVQGTNNYVQLADVDANSPAGTEECLYVRHLAVDSNATLDLNGFDVFVQSSEISGTVTGGLIKQIP